MRSSPLPRSSTAPEGDVDLGVPFFPLVQINFPTYAPDEVPAELAAKPVEKPGSRKA